MINKRSKIVITLAIASLFLIGCQTSANRIDISTYAPVIDTGQYDYSKYQSDLVDCQRLGQKVQVTYEAQRKKEQDQAVANAFLGAFVGAAIGHTVAGNNRGHKGRAATAGAVYGAAIAGAQGSEEIDYTRLIAKFGPTAVVDRCMVGRGYKVLSAEGFGGG